MYYFSPQTATLVLHLHICISAYSSYIYILAATRGGFIFVISTRHPYQAEPPSVVTPSVKLHMKRTPW